MGADSCPLLRENGLVVGVDGAVTDPGGWLAGSGLMSAATGDLLSGRAAVPNRKASAKAVWRKGWIGAGGLGRLRR